MRTKWTATDLSYFANRAEEIAKGFGLDPYPIEFEVVSDRAIIQDQALQGIPIRYPHWSFGKAEKIAEFMREWLGLSVAELISNSNPARARLRASNPLPLQLLTIFHCFPHSDFFKRNRHFRQTPPEHIFSSMKSHRMRVRELQEDSAVGFRAVEQLLDAAHAIRYARPFPSSDEHPSLLRTIAQEAKYLEEWQRELLLIVDEEAEYFAPMIETKILNEGWASYWHEKIYMALPELDNWTREVMRFEHAKTVYCEPQIDQGEWINPYQVGYALFHDIERRWNATAKGKREPGRFWDGKSGREKIFFVSRFDSDASALQSYLSEGLAREVNLIRFGSKSTPANANTPPQTVVLDLADEEGWEASRDALVRQVGLGQFPDIEIVSTNHKRDGALYLLHTWDGRDLDARFTEETLKLLYKYIWKKPVILETKTRRSRTNFWYIYDHNGIRRGRYTVRSQVL